MRFPPEDDFANVGDKPQEVQRANSHIRFALEDSDLSEFSDSVGDLREEHERKVLQKSKRKQKKKNGGGKVPIMGKTSMVHMVDMVRGGRSKGKKCSKASVKSIQEEVPVPERGVEEDAVVAGGNGLRKSILPSSGLSLIFQDEDGSQVPEIPICKQGVDPLKKVEVSSLYGIQNDLGFSFTTPVGANKDRLEKMEVVDVEKKVFRENKTGYQ